MDEAACNFILDDQHEIVVPDASPIIQSLRAIGYSLETAVADIVDNSLDARANQIKIEMVWNEDKSYIRIEDNGWGMSEQELVLAMKLGSKDPLENRGSKELGRFGMGLKTASFSLGQRLTVLTKKQGEIFVRCWDLEVVKATNEWKLKKSAYEDSLSVLSTIEGLSGTVVLIEKLDRVVQVPYTVQKKNKFYRQIHLLEKHIQMVFHRFMEGLNRVHMVLNGNSIKSWDPFYSKLQYTHEMGSENLMINGKLITIEGFILPHHSKMTKEKYIEAAGPNGWYDQQGFYIYRNRRLLTIGSWLSMFPKEESTKLARIRVDIGQDADFDWQIDVKKSVAKPPQDSLDILKRWAEQARDISQKVYYHRGVPRNRSRGTKESSTVDFLWSQTTRNQKPFFIVHQHNPLLEKIRENVSTDVQEMLNCYIQMLQEFCPINTLVYAPTNVNKEIVEPTENERHEIRKLLKVFHQMNMTTSAIVNSLKSMPSLAKYSEEILKAIILEDQS
ncbi:ATP-binding protein [Paenibacillus anseongense]|uniref:ATP-binding protein n=1 Tax=Paenibacillus anseongense TaxID=2682845 RepID=UPI002DB9D34F|nr:ATP-binding protein [Paenibacillus anseongense]MEC0269708.1 ATP-binding protein [Paenibacillus anseongense]